MAVITPKTEFNEADEEVAKRIYCAVLSYTMGLTYQYCMKTYVEPYLGDKKLNDYWLNIAQKTRKHIVS